MGSYPSGDECPSVDCPEGLEQEGRNVEGLS